MNPAFYIVGPLKNSSVCHVDEYFFNSSYITVDIDSVNWSYPVPYRYYYLYAYRLRDRLRNRYASV